MQFFELECVLTAKYKIIIPLVGEGRNSKSGPGKSCQWMEKETVDNYEYCINP